MVIRRCVLTADEAKARIQGALADFSDAAERHRLGKRRKPLEIGSERHEQARVITWLESRGIVTFHPANGGARNPATAVSQGIRAGVPDIIIATPPPKGGYHAAAIEMKRRAGGSVSMAQLEWIEKLRACGWAATICEGAPDAIRWLEGLGYGGGNGQV